MGRKFVRISLGGVRDEAEIRGHRRTYVGALPGRIIQGLEQGRRRTTRSSCSTRSTSSASTSAAIRPRRCSRCSIPSRTTRSRTTTSRSPFDLSQVMFIATANVLDPIPPPLRDRMEVIELAGYTEEEKLEIAQRHLIPKQLDEHGLTAEHLRFEDDAHRADRRATTRARPACGTSSARSAASAARSRAPSPRGAPSRSSCTREKVREFLGPERFFSEVAERTEEPGVADGPRVDARRRRHPLHRGDAHAGQEGAHAHRASSAT